MTTTDDVKRPQVTPKTPTSKSRIKNNLKGGDEGNDYGSHDEHPNDNTTLASIVIEQAFSSGYRMQIVLIGLSSPINVWVKTIYKKKILKSKMIYHNSLKNLIESHLKLNGK